jgi:succinate-semialdehyde dehydrogenase/glutarate-semialdehyde dehydrogenase
VLELGGSDAFIVLAEADLEQAAQVAVKSRFQNAGQSCIAAKRFIVVREAFAGFRDRFVDRVAKLRSGDPTRPDTDIGPLARDDLRAALEAQLARSLESGARVLVGGRRRAGRGFFFEPTAVEGVRSGMPVADEEVFGPVAALIEARDAEDAVRIANQSRYGLGANLWTADLDQAKRIAADIEAGQVFINGMVASDPRLPFGGVKRSGYGRELSDFGIREFVNVQTVWIGPKRDA